jgi:serine/threonine protein kinase
MRNLHHKSIVKILETFESEKYILIIMEYISGGNLQNFVKKRRKLTEKTAKILFKQIIEGIQYIHSQGIVHRDIKLENILLDLNNNIKICDFGVGKIIKPESTLYDQCGTPVYMAPEIIKNAGYKGFPVDIWSSGVALYIMLTGNIPFNRGKIHDLQYNIVNKDINPIEGISNEAKNLIEGLLNKDPNKRLTAEDILNHPWLNNIDDVDTNGLININKYHLFTNAEMILLSKTHIDYRKAQKEELNENFTLKNLFTIDNKNNENNKTKSVILAPYNSMLTFYENMENSMNRGILDKSKYSSLDNFKNEISIHNSILKFGGKVKEFNVNYELNNNEEIDNGMLINSKNSECFNEDKNNNNNNNSKLNIKNNDITDSEIKNNCFIKIRNVKDKNGLNNVNTTLIVNELFVDMVVNLGYNKEYVLKCLENNELNQATTAYYLFSNYQGVK